MNKNRNRIQNLVQVQLVPPLFLFLIKELLVELNSSLGIGFSIINLPCLPFKLVDY